MDDFEIKNIRDKLTNRQFFLSDHSEREKQADKITFSEIYESFLSLEIIEKYPEDKRGPSCLVLGFTKEDKPLHFVIGNLSFDNILMVTMYRPDENQWINYRERRKNE